ncbi:MAG: DEAD/DEAH box helicase family protein [Gemmatimonadaceae bacterium]
MGIESNWERDYDLTLARQRPSTRIEASHQTEALEKLRAWYDTTIAGPAGALLVLPTGGGKTFTAVRFLCRHPLSDGYKVLWLAHTHHLLEQALDAFGKREDPHAEMEVGSIHEPRERLRARVVSGTPGHSRIAHITPQDDVVICTLQSAVRAYRGGHDALRSFIESARGKLMVVFDEAHHAPAPSYTQFLVSLRTELPQLKLLGLTATPMYNDQRREGWLPKLFPQGIVYQVSPAKLIAAGILSKPIVTSCQTHFSPTFNPTEFARWRETFQDLPEGIVTQLATNQSRNAAIANTYVEQREHFGKTIIFADRWPQCEVLRDKLLRSGVRADAVYSHVDAKGATPEERNRRARDDNARALSRFRADELDVLINVRMLTEGTDVPSVKTVFITRQTTSPILLRQMVGRALRGPKFNGTPSANIVMFTDDWREAIQWAEFEEIWSPEAAEAVIAPRKTLPLQLVSIDLVRRLARQMESGVTEPLSFIQLLPLGWYVPEYDVEVAGTDDSTHVRPMVLVYEDEREAYEAFLEQIGQADLARFADPAVTYDAVADDLDEWRAKLFDANALGASATTTNLLHIARHMAQSGGVAPEFIPFAQRELHDLSSLVARAASDDWGPVLTRRQLDPIYSDTRCFWRALFPNFDQFANQFRLMVEREVHRVHGGSSAPPSLESIIAPPTMLPDAEPSTAVKQEVMRRDGAYCRCCGSTERLQIDHIRSVYRGGSNDPDNLQVLCAVCNHDKDVSEMNFHKTATLLSSPPTFTFPSGYNDDDVDALVCDLRRTINMFYQCAAIDEVKYATRGNGRRDWLVTLRTGNPRGWIGEHLEAILQRIQAAQGDNAVGQLRSLMLDGPTRAPGEGEDPIRVWDGDPVGKRPLGAAHITARKRVAVYWPECSELPAAPVEGKIIRADARARTAEVRVTVGRSSWEFSGIPFSAIYPPELLDE